MSEEPQRSKMVLSIKIDIDHMSRTLAWTGVEADRERSMEHIAFMVRNKLQEVQHDSRFGMRRIAMPFDFELEWEEEEARDRIKALEKALDTLQGLYDKSEKLKELGTLWT